VHREDLAVAVDQVVAADRAARGGDPLGRGPEPNLVEKRGGAQRLGGLELVERQIFRTALERDIPPGAEESGDREQARDVLLVVPVVIVGLIFQVDIGPHHQ
jgi:hypothetical protein